MLWGMVNSIGMIVAIAIGINWGTVGVAYGYTLASYASVVWSFFYCFKYTPIEPALVMKAVSVPVISSLGGGGVLIALLAYVPSANAFTSIIFSIIAITCVYIGLLVSIPSGRENLREFWSYRKELFNVK